MARTPHALLLASKKPHHRQLLSQLDSMTEDEIKQLKTNPWVIRGLLDEKLCREHGAAECRAVAIANAMIAASLKEQK